jgi:hypothetical protein
MTKNIKLYMEPERAYHLRNCFEIPALFDFDAEELCERFLQRESAHAA